MRKIFKWYSFHLMKLETILKLPLLCFTKHFKNMWLLMWPLNFNWATFSQTSIGWKNNADSERILLKVICTVHESYYGLAANPLYVCLHKTVELQHNDVLTGKPFRITGLFVSGTDQSPVLTMVCDVELVCFYVSVYKQLNKLLSCRWCSCDTTAMTQSVLSKVSQL